MTIAKASVGRDLRQARVTTRRGAITLLEVMIALVILTASLIAIGQLAFLSRRHAQKARDLTIAQSLCQTKLAELCAGCLPLESVEDEPVLEDPQWTYSVDVQPAPVGDLLAIRVSLQRRAEDFANASQRPATSTGRALAHSRDKMPNALAPPSQGAAVYSLSTWLRNDLSAAGPYAGGGRYEAR